MGLIRVRIPRLHPKQDQIRREARPRNVVAFGRRGGKTVLGLKLVVETALERRGRVGWFVPEYKLLTDAWRDLKFMLGDVARFNDSEKRAEVDGGGVIEAWSFDRNENAGRSRKYHRVIIDEAAHCKNLERSWTKAIAPTLTDYGGDAWFLSSPNGKNYFHSLFDRGQRPSRLWKSWQFTTYDNPHIPRHWIDEQREDLPDPVFAQEYLAEFLDETTLQLIPEAWLDRCWVELPPDGGITGARSISVDISKGTGRDRTVLVVGTFDGLLDLVVSKSLAVSAAAELARDLSVQWGVAHDRIVYDAGGWAGPDMGRYLEALGILAAVPYHGSGPGGSRYRNRRTRSAWKLRQRLDPERPKLLLPRPTPDIAYPELARRESKPPPPRAALRPAFLIPSRVVGGHGQDLRRELLELKYQFDGGQLELERKDDLVARIGKSPDLADAMIMMASLWGDV
jgi:hypothetical protein